MFTDIVGSTERAAALGDARWRELLDRHDRLVTRRSSSRHRGREVKTIGDGFLATFDGPARAIRCARRSATTLPSWASSCASGCTPASANSSATTSAASACTSALASARRRPDEVLVSSTVKDLVVGSGLRFVDRGARELKGVPGKWRLFAVDQSTRRPAVSSCQTHASAGSDRAVRARPARTTGRAACDRLRGLLKNDVEAVALPPNHRGSSPHRLRFLIQQGQCRRALADWLFRDKRRPLSSDITWPRRVPSGNAGEAPGLRGKQGGPHVGFASRPPCSAGKPGCLVSVGSSAMGGLQQWSPRAGGTVIIWLLTGDSRMGGNTGRKHIIVRFPCGSTKEKPSDLEGFRTKRLKGLEPSTFCMAKVVFTRMLAGPPLRTITFAVLRTWWLERLWVARPQLRGR